MCMVVQSSRSQQLLPADCLAGCRHALLAGPCAAIHVLCAPTPTPLPPFPPLHAQDIAAVAMARDEMAEKKQVVVDDSFLKVIVIKPARQAAGPATQAQ